jgi:aconitase A
MPIQPSRRGRSARRHPATTVLVKSCSKTCSALRTGSPSPTTTSRRWCSGRTTAAPTADAYRPARVLMDFTGVPCVVDLAAMRDAMTAHRQRP